MAEAPPAEGLTYEQAAQELDRLIARLEDDEVPLEEALAVYERGVALLKRSAELLDGVERRVTALGLGEGGEPREEPFALEEVPGGGLPV
ncbi:MAG TPA: exodeoxyribonuclease VII small subunit [Candidatus Micrarchaeia archaeon]|nr:exodeoxyribonuclease VII small subunit [Candidatus Micrarchaeia archaeon]